MPLEFTSVTVSYFIHSTEDESRLVESVRSALGLEESEFRYDRIHGHFGNEMKFAIAHLIGKRANDVSVQIFSRLSPSAKRSLSARLEQSVDEHDALFLRLDRQTIKRSLSISDEEPVRVKLKPKIRAGGRSKMIEFYREKLE
ncbi:MAG: hypothetical protein JRN52_10260 [Nitrososphaerota archaeon]|nr:hypothetical protein [Nitrososphaerota archaeon]